jgi:hypothetical protein
MKIRQSRRLLSVVFMLLADVAIAAGPLSLRDAFGEVRKVHTPAPGTVERKALLEALRVKVKELHGLDVIFVIRTMNVSDGWAWVHTLPRSGDGSGSYEDFYALLRRDKGGWHVAEIPCTEPDSPECLDSPGYFRKLAARFPGLPSSILPQ